MGRPRTRMMSSSLAHLVPIEASASRFQTREPLNKSPRARRWPCGMECAKGDDANGRSPFARSLTRQTARKAPSHPGCGKINCSWRCAPWHRSPGYDLRRAPYDHPDFTNNALSEDLFRGSLDSCDRNCVLNHIMFFGLVPGKGRFSHLSPFRSPLPYADAIRRNRLRHYSRVFGR
jgi:hypothetical protein